MLTSYTILYGCHAYLPLWPYWPLLISLLMAYLAFNSRRYCTGDHSHITRKISLAHRTTLFIDAFTLTCCLGVTLGLWVCHRSQGELKEIAAIFVQPTRSREVNNCCLGLSHDIHACVRISLRAMFYS